MKKRSNLEELTLSACPRTWASLEEVEGDARRRHCDECQLHVHDLRAYTKREAERLLDARRDERVCVRKTVRPDGTIVTRAGLGERWLRRGKLAASWLLVLGGTLLAACTKDSREAPGPEAPARDVAPPADAEIAEAATESAPSEEEQQEMLELLGYAMLDSLGYAE